METPQPDLAITSSQEVTVGEVFLYMNLGRQNLLKYIYLWVIVTPPNLGQNYSSAMHENGNEKW